MICPKCAAEIGAKTDICPACYAVLLDTGWSKPPLADSEGPKPATPKRPLFQQVAMWSIIVYAGLMLFYSLGSPEATPLGAKWLLETAVGSLLCALPIAGLITAFIVGSRRRPTKG